MKYLLPVFIVIVLGLLLVRFVTAGQRMHETKQAPVASPTVTADTDTNTNTNSNSNTQLANPASANCQQQGGTLQIKTLPNGGQYGLCNFEDDQACEEWALFRGECPVGGIKTTGFDNEAQKYCAWLGGQTLAVKNAKCTLPDGTVCTDEALYRGTCSSS